MRALVADNNAYQAVKLIRVDWDLHRDDPIVAELKIPRRSTLVWFNKGSETGRVVARTAAQDIEPMFAAAIAG